jgi:hypothetical protein
MSEGQGHTATRREDSTNSLQASSAVAKDKQSAATDRTAATDELKRYKAKMRDQEKLIAELKEQQDKLKKQANVLVGELNQANEMINETSTSDVDDKDDNMVNSEVNVIKAATKNVYRNVKFINNEKQEALFADLVMDRSNMKTLQRDENHTPVEAAKVAKARRKFRKVYEKIWIQHVNEFRNYNQVSATYVEISA